jgi:hypothetical protein
MDLSTTNFIPTDIFYLILEHLTDRRDLYAAALTNRDFNRAATPLLYRTLDTDTSSSTSSSVWGHKTVRFVGVFLSRALTLTPRQTSDVIHPAYSLLRRPELARHVWHIRETGYVSFPFST